MNDGSSSSLASGVYAALLTPRQSDCTEADAAGLLEYLDKVSKAGVDGLVFFGSTGEFIHFDLGERMRVLALAAKRSRLPVLVNVSHSTLAGAVALAEHAAGAGAAGLLLMPPYFYRFEEEVIAEFYAQFVKAIGKALPIYLYNVPPSGASLSPEFAARLLSTGSFAGIKDSSGDWTMFKSLLRVHEQQRFQLLLGNESLYLKALTAGADGSVSGVAAALPELPLTIARAVKSAEMHAAARLSARLDELLGWIETLPALIALKQIADARSWLPFCPAVPLDENSKASLHRFRTWLDHWLPVTLEDCAAVSQPSMRT